MLNLQLNLGLLSGALSVVLLLLTANVGGVSAQQMSINDLPPCANRCAQTAAGAVGCNLADSDRVCLCSHPSFSSATQDCGRSSCPREDIGTVGFVLNQFCSGVQTTGASSSSSNIQTSSSSSASTPSSSSTTSNSSEPPRTSSGAPSTTSSSSTPSSTSTSSSVTSTPTAAVGAANTNTQAIVNTLTNNGLSTGPSTVNVVQTLTVDSDGNPLNPTGVPSNAMGLGMTTGAKGMAGLLGAVLVAGICMSLGRM